MPDYLAANAERLLRFVGPDPSPVQEEMAARADAEGFPIVGPAAGGVLRLLARAVGARSVFEFGSGFGYSATWLAGALPADGRIVLTEIDADELALAREYFAEAGLADRARFEHGDALDIVGGYDGPFDVVLLDHEKRRYADALDLVLEKVRDGGLVIADNAMHGPIDLDDLVAELDGEPVDLDESTRGIAAYLRRVREAPGLETSVLPVGSGLAVSRVGDRADGGR